MENTIWALVLYGLRNLFLVTKLPGRRKAMESHGVYQKFLAAVSDGLAHSFSEAHFCGQHMGLSQSFQKRTFI